jgi:hypothetical protein
MIRMPVQMPPTYPMPPAELTANHGASLAFTLICVAFMAVAVSWVIRMAMRGEPLGVFFLIGGLFMGLLEAYLDYNGLLWFAADNVAIALNLFGRHVPLYVVLGYAFFFGLQSYVIYRGILLGKDSKFFLYAYAVSWFFDLSLQATGSAFGLYRYYGNQPFLIAGVPAWWFTIDATLQLLAGFVFFGLRHRLVRWGRLLVIPLLPMLYAGLNGAMGWPVFTALNSNYNAEINGNGSTALVYLGGSVTICLCAFLVWLLITEIGKAQRRAGIEIDPNATFAEVFLAKIGTGVGISGSAHGTPKDSVR